MILLAFQNYPHPFLLGKYALFFENWEISNNELNVLKLEFEVNIMDNKTSHNSSSIHVLTDDNLNELVHMFKGLKDRRMDL
jgi:hypothetical protein